MENFFKQFFLFALFLGAFAAEEESSNNFSLPEEIPGYLDQPYQGQVFFANDGSCGWWDYDQMKYVQPKLKYQAFDFKCLNEFHWHAFGPACGDPYYEYAKYCAMVKFYENQTPKEWRKNPKNQDMLLVLIDGCVFCSETNNDKTFNPRATQIEATIKLKHTWPAGSFFTTCSETNRTAGEVYLKLGNTTVEINGMADDEEGTLKQEIAVGAYHYGSFTFAAGLFQRRCRGLFSTDPVPDKYQNLTLVVEHNCKGPRGIQEVNIPLADFSPKDFKDNWAELRGLYIKLMDQKINQYSYVEFKYIELANTMEGFPFRWFNTLETEEDGF